MQAGAPTNMIREDAGSPQPWFNLHSCTCCQDNLYTVDTKFQPGIRMQHQKASLSDLPLETLKAIACLLPARAIVRLSTTCRTLRPIVAIPAIWERINFTDISTGLTDVGCTRFLAQITRWMAPSSSKVQNNIEMATSHVLPTAKVKMKFDRIVVSYYTVIAAMQLPQVQRVSFRGGRIDVISDDLESMELEEYKGEALVTAQAKTDSLIRSMDLSE